MLVKIKWPESEEGWAMAEESDVGTKYEAYEEPKPTAKGKQVVTPEVVQPSPSS